MPAGSLRESVTFQRQGVAAGDGKGNFGTAFANITGLVAIAAELTPMRQGETVLAEGVQGRRLYRVCVRYSAIAAAITVKDQMIDARTSVAYNVKAPPINPDKKRKYLEILVETGGANG